MSPPTEFDFVVVGGGTAGNVVAGRLAENPNFSVAVIEADPSNTREIDGITTPARAFELRGSKYDWGFKATFVDRLDYTRVEKPHTRGKVLGGCSCLNYYTWVRGSHGTYDDWVPYGGKTWNWNGSEEYFDKVCLPADAPFLYSAKLAKVGCNGPLDVAINDFVPELETFRQSLTSALVSKGEKLTDNVYEGQQNGLVKCMSTIYKGQRSTSVCFLDNKSNITIIAETEVKKIIIKDGRACALDCIDNEGKELSISVKKEIILSAGVFHSPKLLMLSGIGPKDHLKSFGIETLDDSRHVGQNLLDHPIFPHVSKLKQGCGLDGHLLRAGPMKEAVVRAYSRDRTGPLHSGLLELVGFPRVDKQLEKIPAYIAAKEQNNGLDPFGPDGQPHFEIDFVPCFANAFQWHIPAPSDNSDHLTVIVDLLRSVSKPGEVKLLSSDYKVQPYINLNFMENDLDIIALREGVRFVDVILMTGDGMKDIIGADYPWPLPRAPDEAMNQTILERLQTGFHPCGTCRLSQDAGQGVVDPGLKVHGVEGLRVIDALVFPVIPDCRIQNVVYMVAEKGADIIKAAYPQLYTSAQ